MAVDFNVAPVSVWMGALKAERLQMLIDSDPEKYGHLAGITETPEFIGHVIWGLFQDPELASLSGQTVIGAEIALKYGIRDKGGKQPRSCRDSHQIAPREQYPYIIR